MTSEAGVISGLYSPSGKIRDHLRGEGTCSNGLMLRGLYALIRAAMSGKSPVRICFSVLNDAVPPRAGADPAFIGVQFHHCKRQYYEQSDKYTITSELEK